MPKIGPLELIIILVIVMVIFGAGKLPEIGAALGKSIRSFKEESKGKPETPAATTTAPAKTTEPEKKA